MLDVPSASEATDDSPAHTRPEEKPPHVIYYIASDADGTSSMAMGL